MQTACLLVIPLEGNSNDGGGSGDRKMMTGERSKVEIRTRMDESREMKTTELICTMGLELKLVYSDCGRVGGCDHAGIIMRCPMTT